MTIGKIGGKNKIVKKSAVLMKILFGILISYQVKSYKVYKVQLKIRKRKRKFGKFFLLYHLYFMNLITL
ncbi:MAG: hypothetical protein HW401_417 [Parcubacteria group bacterium]|nr:hypothetical protein [Parcubacteria group bacterium]